MASDCTGCAQGHRTFDVAQGGGAQRFRGGVEFPSLKNRQSMRARERVCYTDVLQARNFGGRRDLALLP
jgi:hypothetical protein